MFKKFVSEQEGDAMGLLTERQASEIENKYRAYKILYCSDLTLTTDRVLTDDEAAKIQSRILLLRKIVKSFYNGAKDAGVITQLIGDLSSRVLLDKRMREMDPDGELKRWRNLSQAERDYESMIKNHPEWRVRSNPLLEMTGSILKESQSTDVAIFQAAVTGAILARTLDVCRVPPRTATVPEGEITETTVRAAMKRAPLKSQQKNVSMPIIRRNVQMLREGKTPPAIKVDNGIIVDGNHRYIAGRIFGQDPPIQPWAGGRPAWIVPWDQIMIDMTEW